MCEIKMLNTQEVAEKIRCSEDTARKLMAQPDFPVVKIGKENLVLDESLKEYVSVRRDLRG